MNSRSEPAQPPASSISPQTRSSHLPGPNPPTTALPTPGSFEARREALEARKQALYDRIRRSPRYHRSRSKYLAVGVAVIAASGALFGAQLKTTWQEYRQTGVRRTTKGALLAEEPGEKVGELALAEDGVNGQGVGGGKVLPASSRKNAERQRAGAAGYDVTVSDLNRSIASLETVRGKLVRMKAHEEGKLGTLWEKMERKRGLEEKRADAARGAQNGGAEKTEVVGVGR
jgi:hypothetical protein